MVGAKVVKAFQALLTPSGFQVFLKRKVIGWSRRRACENRGLHTGSYCDWLAFTCFFNFPGLQVGVPAAIVFPAFDVDGSGYEFAHLKGILIDFITPERKAYFLGIIVLGFQNKLLFFPGISGFAGSTGFGHHSNDVTLNFIFHNDFKKLRNLATWVRPAKILPDFIRLKSLSALSGETIGVPHKKYRKAAGTE